MNITVTQVDDNGVGPVIYDEGVDYEIDSEAGMIFIIPDGNIVADQELKVTFDKEAVDLAEFLGGAINDIRGKLKFVSNPGFGEIHDIEGYGVLSPEGNYPAVTTEYVTIVMKVDLLEHSDYKPGLIKVRRRGNTND